MTFLWHSVALPKCSPDSLRCFVSMFLHHFSLFLSFLLYLWYRYEFSGNFIACKTLFSACGARKVLPRMRCQTSDAPQQGKTPAAVREGKHPSNKLATAAMAPGKAAGNTPANLRAPQRKGRCERRRNAVARKVPRHPAAYANRCFPTGRNSSSARRYSGS